MKLRLATPAALIDIGRIAELQGIAPKGGALRIGALTTHAELAASADVRDAAPALAEAAAQVGDPAVRNRGTIGGNVAHADPASDLPTVLIALGARIRSPGGAASETIDGGPVLHRHDDDGARRARHADGNLVRCGGAVRASRTPSSRIRRRATR